MVGQKKEDGTSIPALRPGQPMQTQVPPPAVEIDEPVASLREQRDSFFQTFFKKGAELTEELLREETRLRTRIEELELANAALRLQVASDDAIRDLLHKIHELEREKSDLLCNFSNAQARSSQFFERFSEVEAENGRLANLYVASFQLHSTLDVRTIIGQVRELLAQLVGAQKYAVYLADESRQQLVPAIAEGFGPGVLGPVSWSEGTLGEVFTSGQTSWSEGVTSNGSLERPAACVPMRLGTRPVGVIVVFSTFEQKTSFEDVDYELFKLLGAHVASALVAARLFTLHGAQIASMPAFLDLE